MDFITKSKIRVIRILRTLHDTHLGILRVWDTAKYLLVNLLSGRTCVLIAERLFLFPIR